MSGKEIKEKIEENNRKIEEYHEHIGFNKFVLNPDIAKLIEENKQLQAQCTHLFINGFCEYCGKEEIQ